MLALLALGITGNGSGGSGHASSLDVAILVPVAVVTGLISLFMYYRRLRNSRR
jgi:hypothetical protein